MARGSGNRWMQEAFNPKKKGALHRQLGYSPDAHIPSGLLHEIEGANVGTHVRGHSVTPLLKKRSGLALRGRGE